MNEPLEIDLVQSYLDLFPENERQPLLDKFVDYEKRRLNGEFVDINDYNLPEPPGLNIEQNADSLNAQERPVEQTSPNMNAQERPVEQMRTKSGIEIPDFELTPAQVKDRDEHNEKQRKIKQKMIDEGKYPRPKPPGRFVRFKIDEETYKYYEREGRGVATKAMKRALLEQRRAYDFPREDIVLYSCHTLLKRYGERTEMELPWPQAMDMIRREFKLKLPEASSVLAKLIGTGWAHRGKGDSFHIHTKRSDPMMKLIRESFA